MTPSALSAMKAGTPLASGLETTADNPVAKFGPPKTPPNACGSTAGPFSVDPALKGPTDADPCAELPGAIVPKRWLDANGD